MDIDYTSIPLVKNQELKRFEIEVEGYFAFINYQERGEAIALIHTETEPELSGKGAAAAVVEKTLNYLEEHNISLLPYCPYVFAYIKRHPDWKRIVSPDFVSYDKL